MEIKVSEIPEEGLGIEFTEEPGSLSGLGEGVKALSRALARFSLKKVGSTVFLTGDVDGKIELVCARCGKSYPLAVGASLKLDINELSALAKEDEKELSSGDLDVEFYQDDTIDLSSILREQLILQVPMKPLCSENCKGLCPQCGQDKNVAECSCSPDTGHPGLSALGELLKDKLGK